MAVKHKQKKFARGRTKRSQRTKDRVVKRYLKLEESKPRSIAFWDEVNRVRKERRPLETP